MQTLMRRLTLALCFTLLLVSCAPQTTPPPADDASQPASQSAQVFPTATISPAAPDEIRFALLGSPRNTNTWELFDQSGASYADYALRSDYFPRLYHLAPPDFSFQPRAAQGLPADIIEEGGFYSARVALRPDLKWSDGSPFTAEDAAFTANVALDFQLGFDWNAAYPREYLARAEAADTYTVKYVFKKRPNVGAWQYGILQGVILQKNFWQSRVAQAAKLLPPPEMEADIEKARARLAQVQGDVNGLTWQLRAIRETGAEGRDVEIILTQRKLELGYAKNTYNKAVEQYQSMLADAQRALYALDGANEPTLGTWMFASNTGGVWVNKVNPDFPFERPNFIRASYRFFADEAAALAAFENNEADFVLAPNGVARDVSGAREYPAYSARFILINQTLPHLSGPALRAALHCMIDREDLAQNILQNQVVPLNGLVVSTQWKNPELSSPCAGMDRPSRIEYAVATLRDAGYLWAQSPSVEGPGKGLAFHDGKAFPKVALSAPSMQADPLRYAAAKYVAEQAQYLGIPFSVKEMSLDDVVYAAFSSGQYDMALVGWRLSEYPGYVCEWFGGGSPYLYKGGKFAAECGAFNQETNLENARASARQIESALLSELSMMPLFIETRAEAYRNLAYPAPEIMNGWSGLYGMPAYAIPAP